MLFSSSSPYAGHVGSVTVSEQNIIVVGSILMVHILCSCTCVIPFAASRSIKSSFQYCSVPVRSFVEILCENSFQTYATAEGVDNGTCSSSTADWYQKGATASHGSDTVNYFVIYWFSLLSEIKRVKRMVTLLMLQRL